MTLGVQERAACENLALAPLADFAGVHRFIPAAHEPQLLAFEALFRSIRDIPLSVSDPSVGMAKLGWWQQELAKAASEGSQHPVVRAMVQTGALQRLDQECFIAYLHGLMMQLQDDCLSSTAELEATLRDTAGVEAQLLTGAQPTPAIIGAACAARLLELLRRLANTDAEHAWLPMDMMARHSVSRAAAGPDDARTALVKDLAELAGQCRVKGLSESADFAGTGKQSGPGHAYIVLRDSLVGKRLAQASGNPAGFLAGTLRPGFGEVITSWKTARRLLRSDRWEA